MDKSTYNPLDVKIARLRTGMTQEEVAEKLGVHPRHVSRVECGDSASPELLQRMGTLYGVNWKSFLRSEEPVST